MAELYIPAPKNAQEAALQARIAERAETLWTDGYSWERMTGCQAGPWYRVTSPKGDIYRVDPLLGFKCNCSSYEQNKLCKHNIAIAKLDAELEFQAAYERNGGDDVYAA